MNPAILWAAAILATILGIRHVLRWAASHLEQLLAEALNTTSLDLEYRQLLEEDA